MTGGELVTRGAIWVAIAGYAGAVILGRYSGNAWRRQARGCWTLGLLAYLIHVVAAFGYFYDWSHAKGLEETASQTRELTGLDSGSGLYLNYVFTLVWLTDAVHWWIAGLSSHAERHRIWHLLLHTFFLFMIVNGAIIFASGPVRWFTAVLLILLGVHGLRQKAVPRHVPLP